MKAVTWHGRRDVRVETVDDPTIQEPTDAIIKVTSTGICGSDLHLYEVMGPFMTEGDILGHEPIGIVAEVGPQAGSLKVGDRVVVPFNISCGTCFMCGKGLHSQCETTPGPRRRQRRGTVRLHPPVRIGSLRPGRVPAGAPSPVRADRGTAGPAR